MAKKVKTSTDEQKAVDENNIHPQEVKSETLQSDPKVVAFLEKLRGK